MGDGLRGVLLLHERQGQAVVGVRVVWPGAQHFGVLSDRLICLALRYQDAAPAYNPLAAPARSTDLHTTQPGGFGIDLLRGMATAVRYCRENERNTLELEFSAKPRRAGQ